MFDLSIALNDKLGALPAMGEALGRSGVSIEGGGAWVMDGLGTAHFLFKDGQTARAALEAKSGASPLRVRIVPWAGESRAARTHPHRRFDAPFFRVLRALCGSLNHLHFRPVAGS